MNYILLVFITAVIATKGFDLKLFNKIGVAIENLKDNVIVTHGYQTIPLRVEMRLPSVEDEEARKSCSAAGNESFTATVKQASSRFREQIKKELAEFINLEDVSPSENQHVSNEMGGISVNAVKGNPSLCSNERVKCKFFPIMDEPDDDIREAKPRACYDSTFGQVNVPLCQVKDSVTVCCAKRASSNTGACPRESLGESLSVLNRQDIRFPNRIHKFNHGNVPANRVNNYCIALLWVEIDGKRVEVGGFTDSKELDDSGPTTRAERSAGSDKNSSGQTHTRQRRSNWQYYTSGGWFTSNYIDNQISQVKDIETADTNALKLAVEKNSRVLLTLQADRQEKEHLRQAICSASEHLSEELVLAELKSSQSKLEFKSELMLRSCSSQIVPDQIASSLLTKLCTSQSNSPHCYGKAVRSIFSCKLTKPLISMDVVGVAMILTMHIPLDEQYKSFRLHSIGVPYRSNAIDVQRNISDPPIKTETVTVKNNPDVEEALRHIFNKIGQSRQRREIVTTHHFLRVTSLPDIVISYENDLVSFMDSDCTTTPFGLIADYSNNMVEDDECVKSIFTSSEQRISHYCSIRLESSTHHCQVRHISDIGYLVSTSDTILVSDITVGRKSVFNNKIDTSCKNDVCVVTVGKAAKRFKCGRRMYRVGSHDQIKINVQNAKLSKIDISALTIRKSDRSEMILTGFNAIDQIPVLNKELIAKTGTISTLLTLLVTSVMSLLCIKYACKRSFSALCFALKRFSRSIITHSAYSRTTKTSRTDAPTDEPTKINNNPAFDGKVNMW